MWVVKNLLLKQKGWWISGRINLNRVKYNASCMTKYFTLQLALLSIKLAHTSMTKKKQAQRENTSLSSSTGSTIYCLFLFELYYNIDFSAKYTKISK